MSRWLGWPLIIIVSASSVALAMVGLIEAPIRPLIAFWFMLVCPGMAFIRLLRLEERLTELVLAIALSLTLDTLVAEIMAVNQLWSAKWGLFVLICLSLGGAMLQIVQAYSPFWLRQTQHEPVGRH